MVSNTAYRRIEQRMKGSVDLWCVRNRQISARKNGDRTRTGI